MPGFNFAFHCQGTGKVVILVLISSPFILRRFYACSLFDHGSRRVRPWFNNIFNANTLHIQPNIHLYTTHLFKYVVYTWYMRGIYVIYAWYISRNHGWTMVKPWSNIEYTLNRRKMKGEASNANKITFPGLWQQNVKLKQGIMELR